MNTDDRDGYPERADGHELFDVRGGQGRSAQDVVDASAWLTVLLAVAAVAIMCWVAWRLYQ